MQGKDTVRTVRTWRGARAAVLGLLLGGSVGLVGCGGGGGSEAGGGPPVAPPAPVQTLGADLYPLATGDRRSWRVVEPNQPVTTRHERVGEPLGAALVVRELTLASFERDARQADDEVLLQRSSAGITELPGAQADALTRAVGPVELLRFGLALGQRVRLAERSVSADLDGDGRQDAAELRIDSEFVGVESVTTPAGAFANASKVRTSVAVTLRLAASAQPVQLEQVGEEWLAPGIGPVRRTLSSRSGNAAPETHSEELIAYRVGALRSELATPALSLAKPAHDSASRPDVQIELEFNRPIDPLSLAGDGGLRLLRDGREVVLNGLTMVDSARALRVFTRDYPLPDGQYELRHAGQASDWAGNLLPEVLLRFQVDTQGPRLLSSSPADGAEEAARQGRIEFRFDEALRLAPGATAVIWLKADVGSEEWTIPATLSGNVVSADLPQELRINSLYRAVVSGALTDAQGNGFAPPDIRFRTDPGPLSRPQTWWPDAADVALALADMNGDGRPDLLGFGQAIGTDTHRLVLRLQRSGGGFEPLRELHAGPRALCDRRFAAADMNGDGRLDVVLPTQCQPGSAQVLLLQGADGSFVAEAVPSLDPSGHWTGQTVALAGGAAAMVWRGLNGLQLWQREGDGRWRSVAAPPLADSLSLVRAADLNGDGRQDLVWLQAHATQDGLDLAWSLQGANASWSSPRQAALALVSVQGLLVTDWNQDRRADIVLSGRDGADQDRVLVMRAIGADGADGSASFALAQMVNHPWRPGGLAAGDLNADGRIDLVVAEESFRTGVLLQQTDGSFEDLRRHEAGFGRVEGVDPVALVDLDGDGRLDLLQGHVVLLGRAVPGPWPKGLSAPPAAPRSLRLLQGLKRAGAQAGR